MKRRSLLAGVGAGLASALAGCSGAIRRLEFVDVSHRETEDGVEVEMGIYATTNVEGDLADFESVSVAGFTCDARLVGQQEVGHVPKDATRNDPVRATMVCETLPDAMTLDATVGPCQRGVATYGWAVYTGEEWTLNGFKRNCGEQLPPERICSAIGKERPPGPVQSDGDESGGGFRGNESEGSGDTASGNRPTGG